MTIYRRKAVAVEAFQYYHEPQPQWFVDATHNGEIYDDGGRTLSTFRIKGSGRVLRMNDGDFVIKRGDKLWVCERDMFPDLYEVPVAEAISVEAAHAQQVTVGMVNITAALTVCIGLGFAFGAAVGWILAGVCLFVLSSIMLARMRQEQMGREDADQS